MKLTDGLGELTYCLNVHPAETWAEVRAALEGPARRIKAAVCPDETFGLGLRFSARCVAELEDPAARAELKSLLAEAGFRPFTVNGFPYGPFHGTRVKEDVYQPDWRRPERLGYTRALADLMADLADPGDFVSLSTVPGCFRPLATGAEARMAEAMLRAAAHCIALERRTGVHVALAIEPEPFCFLETIAETAEFFREHLYSRGAAEFLAGLCGLTPAAAAALLPRFLGLCYDVCHAAVEFEDPGGNLRTLARAGIPIHKLQLSAALRLTPVTPQGRHELAAFAEPTYLHQVVARRGGEFSRLPDLPQALARKEAADGDDEWRVHFHVPVYRESFGRLSSTRGFLREILALHRAEPLSPHLEVETYTWGVLPDRAKRRPAAKDTERSDVEEGIVRELGWVIKELRQ